MSSEPSSPSADSIVIPLRGGQIAADLRRPARTLGLVIFAHAAAAVVSAAAIARSLVFWNSVDSRRCCWIC